MSPPAHAMVFCVDEKSQIEALERTQPGLPLRQGRVRTMTHDYKRHGTTTLSAALNTLDGTVIGRCAPRHRHQEWLAFLKELDAQTPTDKTLHLILDNYATYKHAQVKAWLVKHPRVVLHFTPTGPSWLNWVERFFRDLTVNRVHAEIFPSVEALIKPSKTISTTTIKTRSPLSGRPKLLTFSPSLPSPAPLLISSLINDALH